VKAVLEVVASGTAYFDAGWLLAGAIQKYTIPSSIIAGPHYLTEQGDELDPTGEYYPIRGGPTSGRRLRFEGMGLLSRPSSDTATTEVGAPQINIITAYAGMYFFRTQGTSNAIDERSDYTDLASLFSRDATRMASQPGLRMPRLGAQKADNVWHIEKDSSGRYLIFDRGRV